MDVSLYQAAAAMNATQRWQELISENLASASIPGARKREISFSSVQAGQGNPGFSFPSATSQISFQQGELRPTGDSMNLAIEGSGFFSVQLPDGQTAYTRDGQFQLNTKNELTTAQGFPVLGTSGPIKFNPANKAKITISENGEITQGAEKKGRLQLVEFVQPGLLTPISRGLFRADAPELKPIDAGANTNVRQGFIESSNTSPTAEMATLLTAMRMFESNQKVLQMQSDRMSREISELGNPS